MREPARRPAQPFLIAAVTGRALAASAARAGHAAVVLDYFADQDTRAVASQCRAVRAASRLRFDAHALLAAASELAPPAESAGLVYGSGFEGRTGLLARLARGRRLLGNPPSLVTLVKDPRRFFPLLDRLGIRHPEVRYAAPDNPAGWLLKRSGGAGGTHVRHAGLRRPRAGEYLQAYQPGHAASALFLADGRRAFLVGFNRQWTSPARDGLSFLYGGAVGRVALSPELESDLRSRLDALVAATGLVGLNGLDFLLREGEWSALEVNPRPTATMELYDPDFPDGLFDCHVRAARGELPEGSAPAGPSRAHAIVLASADWRMPAEFRFPPWCRDLPAAGVRFSVGDPVCTVHAEADLPEQAVRLVNERAAALERATREQTAEAVRR
jgi:predicted ATP-grasp superfamily ATP-dependent carboligase